jgi:hypothetical protein
MIRRTAPLLAVLLFVAGCETTQSNAPKPQTKASIPSAPPRGEPGQYANMPAVALQAAFGRPAFVRKDGATEMWRYDGSSCRAFFFLYGAPLAVRHVETLPHARAEAADIGCLNALRVQPPKVS